MPSSSLPLVFDAPRRGMPPRHLADLSAAERKAAVGELGERLVADGGETVRLRSSE